ncbi:MAG TPA: AAA family ATPase [Candidatus Aenigmarchaeota archaeon]|nr:AAA family ATPase [Candidatus Aenigmarchaeota archaeon]
MLRRPEVLDPDFMPEHVFHREREINAIRGAISPLLQGRRGENLFIYGPPGVGKTLCAKYVFEQFDFRKAYINCWFHRSPYNLMAEIARQLGIPIPLKGWSLEEVVKEVVKRSPFLVILDEVDKASEVNEIYPLVEGTKACFILITNFKEWFMGLDPRLSSRLHPTFLEFKPYSFEQMLDIVKERVKLAFAPGSVEKDALVEIARRAFLRRDVRVALHLLQKASKFEKIDLEKVNEIAEEFRKKPFLNEMEKRIVEWIKENEGKTTGELYKKFEREMTERSFRNYIKKLERMGVIRTEETGKGFRGRSRRIYLSEQYEI